MQPQPNHSGRIALALALGFSILYLATLQAGLFNDGVFFEHDLRRGHYTSVHVLTLPWIALLQHLVSLVHPITEEAAIKISAALWGGAGVAMSYIVASQMLPSRRALIAALVLGVLPGFWFQSTATEIHSIHAALAMVLFLGMQRALNPQSGVTSTCLLLFVGAFLSPSSHGSGIAAGIAAFFVVATAPRKRALRYALSGLAGVGCWFGVLQLMMWIDPSLRHGRSFAASLQPFRSFEAFVRHSSSSAREMSLYAIPVATLAPAGIVRLFHADRRQSVLAGLWIFGYWLMTLWVIDDAIGSYFTPLFPVFAALALVACGSLGASPSRSITTVLLSFAPAIPHELGWGMPASLGTLAVSAALLVALSRRDRREATAWPLIVITLLLSSTLYVPKFFADPVRDRIRAVAEFTGPGQLTFILAPNASESYQWLWHFPGVDEADFIQNPYTLEFVLPPAAQQLRDAWMARVEAELANGKSVWILEVSAYEAYLGRATQFQQELATKYRLESPAEAPPGLQRIALR